VSPPPAGALALGETRLRRLTRDEYNNTVRDLLGDGSRPGLAFAADSLGDGGFVSGGIVSPVEADQYLEAGERLAIEAVKTLGKLLPCDPATGEDACAQRFIQVFGKRAYRRPLAPEEIADLQDLYQYGKTNRFDFPTRIRFVVTAMLQSPSFLYRWEFGRPVPGKPGINALTSWEVASRLSYFAWGSMPDEELFAKAESGALVEGEELAAQARRLLASPRARDAVRAFRNGWLHFIDGGDVPKDVKKFRTWNGAVLAALDRETEEMVARAAAAGPGGFALLLTADHTYANTDVARFYGLPDPGGATFQKVAFPAGSDRSGVLTHGSVLARNAGPSSTSPVRRGHMIREQLLCDPPPPPPANLNPAPPAENAMASIRQQVLDHQKDPACSACHKLIDGFGLALEGFDAVGLVRTVDAGKPIDASGEVSWPGLPGSVRFRGARELGETLAGDATAQRCFARQMFRFAMGRMDDKDGATVDRMLEAFRAARLDVREVMVALVRTDAFRYRKALAGEGEVQR
jgi:hypothetical protein